MWEELERALGFLQTGGPWALVLVLGAVIRKLWEQARASDEDKEAALREQAAAFAANAAQRAAEERGERDGIRDRCAERHAEKDAAIITLTRDTVRTQTEANERLSRIEEDIQALTRRET